MPGYSYDPNDDPFHPRLSVYRLAAALERHHGYSQEAAFRLAWWSRHNRPHDLGPEQIAARLAQVGSTPRLLPDTILRLEEAAAFHRKEYDGC